MHDPVMERATLAARRDFDLLPRSTEIAVQPARRCELSALADMANRLVPGVQIAEPDLERYFNFDPGSILTFSRNDRLLGAVAFIYLINEMQLHGVSCAAVEDLGWGVRTHVMLPGGGQLGIYQPRHARPRTMGAKAAVKRARRGTARRVTKSKTKSARSRGARKK